MGEGTAKAICATDVEKLVTLTYKQKTIWPSQSPCFVAAMSLILSLILGNIISSVQTQTRIL